jgi:cytochrome c-type biogenesis protein CcmF
MTAEIGYYALLLALVISLVQSVVPIWMLGRDDPRIAAFVDQAALAQLVFVGTAFGCLTYAFVTSDFSLSVVAANSHSAKPLLYKISGVWGNHEGSMLLWVLILSLFGAAVAVFGVNIPERLRGLVLGVHGMIGFGFLAFIVATSNPFAILSDPPTDGAGLNPILQDPGLAFHPPFLYLGYVGFSMAHSFSVAALIEGRVDACWARWVRPWVLAAWCFLTIGIALGSFWAYYTLGWGGWWFWDPVENASLTPWLAGTALLHSALVVERRNTLISWTVLLGIVTFTLSLIGTFLVRSGVLTSVHAFAQDPSRGIFILGLVGAASGGALTLFAVRAGRLKSGAAFGLVSREAGLVFNNALLSALAMTVFLGTFYPLVIDMIGTDKISVGPPFYNRTFAPLTAPLLVAMALGPALKWERDELFAAFAKLKYALAAAVAALAATLAFGGLTDLLAAVFMGLAGLLVVGSFWIFAHRVRLGSVPLETSLRLAFDAPRAFYGLVIAHAGMGVLLAGVTGMSAWASERVEAMHINDVMHLSGYDVKLRSVRNAPGPNYEAERASFEVTRNGRAVTKLVTEKRFFPVREQQTTSAGIHTNLISNLYIALGDFDEREGWTVRFYVHPFVPFIWIGALFMALGGFVSLSDRRLRIGAPQRAAVRLPLAETA